MPRLKIADVARSSEKTASDLQKVQVAVGLISVWLLALSTYVFFF